MVDRYQEDFQRCQEIKTKMDSLYEERRAAEAAKKPTSTVDYRLKSEAAKLTKEVTGLEKLIYLYENNDAKYVTYVDLSSHVYCNVSIATTNTKKHQAT